ncbi:MAG TPA: ROK family transcriptional regulator [Chloroflexia bacterium]|nr:ROK family transcriptional regulator [Chloroflexia bacterium]
MPARNPPANKKLIRDINQNSLLNLVKNEGPVSRTRLAELSGLSLATISGITAELIERNLVVETSVAESTGGRKAVLLNINPDGGYVIGLKLTEYRAIAVILNLNAELIYSENFDIQLRGQDKEVLYNLAREVNALVNRSELPREKMIGLGCGMPGIIDGEQGRCIDSPIFGWQDFEVSEPLGTLLGMPVYIDNDVNSLAIYEKLFGQGQPFQHFLTVTVGRGVGLGLVINGDLFRGAFGGAGEFGHVTLIDGGRKCECGKAGCLEAYLSDRGILETYISKENGRSGETEPLQDLTIEEVIERGRQGNQAALATYEEAGRALGISLANLVNVLNPELILLSGEGARAGDLLYLPLERYLRAYVFSHLADKLKLAMEAAGDESWARGAASLVLRQFFLSPIEARGPTLVASGTNGA